MNRYIFVVDDPRSKSDKPFNRFITAKNKAHAYQRIAAEHDYDPSEILSLKEDFKDFRKHTSDWEF